MSATACRSAFPALIQPPGAEDKRSTFLTRVQQVDELSLIVRRLEKQWAAARYSLDHSPLQHPLDGAPRRSPALPSERGALIY